MQSTMQKPRFFAKAIVEEGGRRTHGPYRPSRGMLRAIALCVCAVASTVSSTAYSADATTNFYSNKTVKLIIGAAVGGAYGTFSQLVAKHIGKFIPGTPTVIVQSMPSGGGLVALNYMSSTAPKDGTVFALAHATLVQEGLFNPKAKFNPAEFEWIGRLTTLAFLGVVSKNSGIKTLDDAKKREVIAGSTPGTFSVPAQAPLILNRIAGTKFKVIGGYKGTAGTFIALERGEIESTATSLDNFKALHWEKLQSGELIPIYAQALHPIKEFPNVPTLLGLAKTETEKAFLNIFSVSADVGRSFMAPPGIEAGRLKILRAAFDEMIKDESFLADVKKLHIDLHPLPGSEVQKMVAEVTNIPADTREKAKAYYEDLFKK